jgi:hypothetical protein
MSFDFRYEVRPCLYHTSRLILGDPFTEKASRIIDMGVSIVIVDASLLQSDGYHRVIRLRRSKPSVVLVCQDGHQCA